MSRGRGLSGGHATRALAGLALTRAVRGKALWIALALVLLPLIVVGVRVGLGHPADEIWETAFGTTLLVLPVVPSILVSASLSDELEEKTAAYLWSRALPRWSIVAGKLVGLAPIAAVIVVLGLTGAWALIGGPSAIPADTFARGVVGMAAGALAGATIAAMWATIVPRHAVAVSVVWLLFVDLPLGTLPVKVHYLSASFAALAIAGFEATAADGVAAFALLIVVPTAIAIRRI